MVRFNNEIAKQNVTLTDITPEEEKQLKPEKQSKEKIGLLRFISK